MKLRVLPTEHFTCHSCTNCCRHWHVELIEGEADRLTKCRWPQGDPLAGASVLLRHSGKTFVAHRLDGACIFLNESNGRCRIHEQFGAAAKPLGCRLFPFQVAPTFDGEATVIGRFDCPTIRQNKGAAHADELPAIRQLLPSIHLPPAFDENDRCHLEKDQIQAATEFVVTMLPGLDGDERKALFIAYLCDGIAATMAEDLDRGALARAYPILRNEVEQVMSTNARRPGMAARMSFRMLLGMYLRRDEDVLDGRAGRVGRAIAMGMVVLGFGNIRRLGVNHPIAGVHRARLFSPTPMLVAPGAFELFWRMVQVRLESLQFMGSAAGGRNFIEGLRMLVLLYPLVRAAARIAAEGRGASQVGPQDVDFAVAAIEHSFGRLAVLNQSSNRSVERLLIERAIFTRLARTV